MRTAGEDMASLRERSRFTDEQLRANLRDQAETLLEAGFEIKTYLLTFVQSIKWSGGSRCGLGPTPPAALMLLEAPRRSKSYSGPPQGTVANPRPSGVSRLRGLEPNAVYWGTVVSAIPTPKLRAAQTNLCMFSYYEYGAVSWSDTVVALRTHGRFMLLSALTRVAPRPFHASAHGPGFRRYRISKADHPISSEPKLGVPSSSMVL